MSSPSPILPTFTDICQAAERIGPYTTNTPSLSSQSLSKFVNAREVFIKCENLQKSGSFKARGAFNAICSLSPEEASRGVIAFSSGNHALGISLAAQTLNVPGITFFETLFYCNLESKFYDLKIQQ